VRWTIAPPAAGTRDPVVVTLTTPLDRGVLQRAIGVAGSGGAALEGEVTVGDLERSWRFTPAAAWRADHYSLVVLDILEDPAGNRVGRPFDIDTFEHIDRSAEPGRISRSFDVR
jgi:hypothetical protein